MAGLQSICHTPASAKVLDLFLSAEINITSLVNWLLITCTSNGATPQPTRRPAKMRLLKWPILTKLQLTDVPDRCEIYY